MFPITRVVSAFKSWQLLAVVTTSLRARVLPFDSLGSCLRFAQGIINEGFGQRGAFADIQEVKTDLTRLPLIAILPDPRYLAGDGGMFGGGVYKREFRYLVRFSCALLM